MYEYYDEPQRDLTEKYECLSECKMTLTQSPETELVLAAYIRMAN